MKKHALASKLRRWLDRFAPETPKPSPKTEPLPELEPSPKEVAWDAVEPFLLVVTGMPKGTAPTVLGEALISRLDRLTDEYEHLVGRHADLRALIESQQYYATLILEKYTLHRPLWALFVERGWLIPEHVSTPMGLHEVMEHLAGLEMSSQSRWRH